MIYLTTGYGITYNNIPLNYYAVSKKENALTKEAKRVHTIFEKVYHVKKTSTMGNDTNTGKPGDDK